MNGNEKWKRKMDTMSENEKGKIIQFPSKMAVSKDVKIDNFALTMHDDLKFADHLTEGLVVNLIHNLGENGIDTSDPEFIRDVGFTIELVKSLIYRGIGLKHPMQELVKMFVTTDEDDKEGLYTTFDIDALSEFVGMDEDEKE